MCTFFIASGCLSQDAQHGQCAATSATESATVAWVYDADTLKLKDGRKIRLIGIDAPEMPNKKTARQGEAFAGQATEALRELLASHNYQILLQPGVETHDKYRRLLAHVYTEDGINLSAWLLKNGYARTLFIPPNLQHDSCYIAAETDAQQQGLRIWSQASHQITKATDIDAGYAGFIRLQGTVRRVKRRTKDWRLTLDSQIYITIKKSEAGLFNELSGWTGKTVIATGILQRRQGRAYMRVQHPAQLQITSQ